MDIEEAKFILSNVEIDAPSVRSQIYFDSNEVNLAIETTLQTLEENEEKIVKLEENLKEILDEVKNLNASQKEQEGIFVKLKNSLMSLKSMRKQTKYKTITSC